MPRGGARTGAGRPKKALADKLLEGNPGKRELTQLKFSSENNSKNSNAEISKNSNIDNSNTPKSKNQTSNTGGGFRLPSYLDMVAKEGGDVLPPASEIYKMLTDWIDGTGCSDFIAPNLVEDFAFLRRGYLECEYMNRKLGRIASGKRSPYVNMALDYQKAMMTVYNQIWLIISRNCDEKYEGKNAFLEMLTNRGF